MKLCETIPSSKWPCPEICGEMCIWWCTDKCLMRKKHFIESVRGVIEAWDSLEGDNYYISKEIEDWLVNVMAPAIKVLREEYQ